MVDNFMVSLSWFIFPLSPLPSLFYLYLPYSTSSSTSSSFSASLLSPSSVSSALVEAEKASVSFSNPDVIRCLVKTGAGKPKFSDIFSEPCHTFVWSPAKVTGKKIENMRVVSVSSGGQHTALLVSGSET